MVDHQAQVAATRLSADDIRGLCGDILDWKLEAILELEPSAVDVAAAVAWAEGTDELAEQGRPLSGMTAQVYDLLVADGELDEQR